MAKPNYTISTEVNEDLLLRLDAEAERRGINRFALVGQLLAEALNAPQTSNTDILEAVERLHQRLDQLEHHPTPLPDSDAIPLPPAPAPELVVVVAPEPESEPMVELTSEELADLLEPEPIEDPIADFDAIAPTSEPPATPPIEPTQELEPTEQTTPIVETETPLTATPNALPDRFEPDESEPDDIEPDISIPEEESVDAGTEGSEDPMPNAPPAFVQSEPQPLVETSVESPIKPTAKPSVFQTPDAPIVERREVTELNFDELCQHIGVNPQELTAAAYKHDQSPISALAWRTGWTFNFITQRFTKPSKTEAGAD
ncbi:MAG: hypothetical protein F6J87_19155 [Spirulina sp. SIO3F2]|nr:hypothetical protein [Spirulina sp. SIO3F2]